MVYMSEVLRRNRRQSGLDFVDNAADLEATTRKFCKNNSIVPKSYTFYGGTDLYHLSREIHSGVVRGNSIYPTNQREARLRRKYLLEAYAALRDMISLVSSMDDSIGFKEEVYEEWSRLLYKENNLIKNVLESDKKRYQNLPE